MATYLLAWNPKRWNWENLEVQSNTVKSGEVVTDGWSCGNSKKIVKGDRVFLIKLGEKPKGIFASGTTITSSYKDTHWDDYKAALGDKARFVRLQFDTLLNPYIDDILPRELLNQPLLSEMHWDTQMSGIRIPDHIADELEKLWDAFTKDNNFTLPNEVDNEEPIFEGSVQQIKVNAYERSSIARLKCIAHYGTNCFICGFDFATTYGEIGKDYIHVHHVRQLASIGKKYQIDPIRDLRPICPNCHAIIHRRKPAYSIEEMRKLSHNPKQQKSLVQ